MYQLRTKVFIPYPLAEVWDFFSAPENLKRITPSSMGFDILTESSGKMYPGQMIAYIVRPLAGIPTKWVTEITHVREAAFFVDEQRVGPYRMWHHEHHFTPTEGGVLMEDIVSYQLPFGFLGRLVHPWLVKPKLKQIFGFRSEAIAQIFPGSTESALRF